jgi:hypothetical protein
MPFLSEVQRRFMFAKHPDIAKKWSREYGPQKGLPEHVGKRRRRVRRRKAY